MNQGRPENPTPTYSVLQLHVARAQRQLGGSMRKFKIRPSFRLESNLRPLTLKSLIPQFLSLFLVLAPLTRVPPR